MGDVDMTEKIKSLLESNTEEKESPLLANKKEWTAPVLQILNATQTSGKFNSMFEFTTVESTAGPS